MLKPIISFLIISFSLITFSQKKYVKNYFNNGNLKEEGWSKNNKKTAYWKFYYKNGSLKEEGSFKDDKKIKEWTDFSSFKKENNLLDLR